jgi:hypothetical protein
MSELHEKDPQLASILDKQSQRNLLDPSNPNPVLVDLEPGKPVRFALEICNGQEGLIDLAISSDEPWLEPESSRLTLVGGESKDCIIRANLEGDAEFANLLFSWEGMAATLCQPVMVQRKLPAAPPSAEAASPQKAEAKREENAQNKTAAIDNLKKFIDGCAPDKFIDIDEEHQIFRKGGALELSLTETESILNRMCSEGGWTRQSRLTDKLTAMLHEATKDDGVIDKQEYDHVVNFAIKRLMPRRDADEHCITLILDNAWKAKEGMFDKWFTKKRKQYGL